VSEQLILVRHGETVYNVAGIAQGWGDSALSEAGQRQVAALARRVAAMSPDAIYSSPLQRALSTAEEIGRVAGLQVQIIDELREMNYGTWEGQRFLEVRQTDVENYRRWIDDVAFPCPDGESHQDVLDRLRHAFGAVAGGGSAAKRPVVVTHGTAIRIGATALMDLPLSAARNFAQDNAALNVFLRRGERWVLKLWNDTTHWTEG
jgi:broad specificity phosphatase PhoE